MPLFFFNVFETVSTTEKNSGLQSRKSSHAIVEQSHVDSPNKRSLKRSKNTTKELQAIKLAKMQIQIMGEEPKTKNV